MPKSYNRFTLQRWFVPDWQDGLVSSLLSLSVLHLTGRNVHYDYRLPWRHWNECPIPAIHLWSLSFQPHLSLVNLHSCHSVGTIQSDDTLLPHPLQDRRCLLSSVVYENFSLGSIGLSRVANLIVMAFPLDTYVVAFHVFTSRWSSVARIVVDVVLRSS